MIKTKISALISIIHGKVRYGNNSTSSTSKIRNKIVTKKKCKENGTRNPEWGANPHSKGEAFSWSINCLIWIILLKTINRAIIKIIRISSDIKITINK